MSKAMLKPMRVAIVLATETTTLRVPVSLRDEIALLAAHRNSTMLQVVTDAVHRLTKDQWWDTVDAALDAMTPDETADYQQETVLLDATAHDGLNGR